MNKIEHLGIAVKNAASAKEVFDKLLNKPAYKTETVESEGVSTIFYELGPNKLELLEATNPNSPIAKYLEKNREGIHHVAIAVDDIEAEMVRLKSEGFIFINDQPKQGADNKLIAFIHPKSANGLLVELCQDRG
jgi:methylmalonyl-CoA/ethylmalonyl-CoA epimerase